MFSQQQSLQPSAFPSFKAQMPFCCRGVAVPGRKGQPCSREGLKPGGQESSRGCPGQGGGDRGGVRAAGHLVAHVPRDLVACVPRAGQAPQSVARHRSSAGQGPSKAFGVPGGGHAMPASPALHPTPRSRAGGQNSRSHVRGQPYRNKVPGGRTRAARGQEVVNNIFNE